MRLKINGLNLGVSISGFILMNYFLFEGEQFVAIFVGIIAVLNMWASFLK